MQINRDKAITMLEQQDDTWCYEDMTDEELVLKAAQTIMCSKENRMSGKCRSATCIECWENVLSA